MIGLLQIRRRPTAGETSHRDKLLVAHVGPYKDDASGVNQVRLALFEWLPKAGIEVQIWYPSEDAEDVVERREGDGRIYTFPRYRRPWNFVRALKPRTRAALEELVHDVDIVHFHSGFIPESIAIAELLAGTTPYIITPHGTYSGRSLSSKRSLVKRTWMKWREHSYVNGASRVQAVSPSEREELKRLVPRERLVTIPNGIDPVYLSEDIERVPTTKTILFLGRLAIAAKGLDLLIDAFKSVVVSDGAVLDPRLVLTGPDSRGSIAILRKMVRQAGIEDKVVFNGPRFGEEKRALLSEAYAFVHTSRWEAMPLSVLEALAMGVPVVVTPETNVGDYVNEYGAGVVVAGQKESIAQGLRYLLSLSSSDYLAMRRQARQLALQHFAWNEVSEQLSALYREVARSS